ncbi:SMI1/KNR4 family protein [Streptacidiphilus fuscans]|uniref:SMI1/KNR4 family protein n=1 Tax=Streptacidiphilus fuscans TaxID=2789292 RepID=A0A931B2C5_9ACTN|nr:SMI1/KNR4 family protein [Streptacidiphilus fuscans]MBF9069099.1 SMI1/KNR4 family protein [Streptacidiphilus fuscans]
MWIELVSSLPGPTVLRSPASESSLQSCADALGHALPIDLAALLRESDGVEGEYGAGLVWSADRIASENLTLRQDEEFAALYMPFDPLIFFADAGNGDLFALLSAVRRPDVFVWDHETDSRTWVAPSLAKYLEWWQAGHIEL